MSDSNYYDRFSDNQGQPQKQEKKVVTSSTAFSLAKIFGFMFIGLLITAGIALGLGAYFNYALFNNEQVTNFEATNAIILIALLITSFIGIIVLSIVVPITVARGKHSVLVPSIIYTVLMGVMLSTLTLFIPWYILGLTFGITSLVFGIMALIALISKSRLNGLAIVAIGLFIGAGIMVGAMFILSLFTDVTTLYWIITIVVFAAVMFITLWDIARIKAIAQKGEMTNNLSLYCAFILYNDFISIFLRLLRIILLVMSKK